MKLNVLIVEDDREFLAQLERDLPQVFLDKDIDVIIHPTPDFDDALRLVKSSHIRYDMVISDTYKGEHKDRNTAVLNTIAEYRRGKFCPIIVCSSGEYPPDLNISAFVRWVDKANLTALDDAINGLLDLGVPQIANQLHSEVNDCAGSYLWDFLEKNWADLNEDSQICKEQLGRLVRGRAALKMNELRPDEYVALDNRYGLEYYIYPALNHDYFSLGDLLRNKNDHDDIRVILTPHCHLFKQPGAELPRAEFVLTIKAISAEIILGQKLENAKSVDEAAKLVKLRKWANSPAQTGGKPEGRHWYLPKFLKIPHLFCDFLQVTSFEYSELVDDYETVATLSPPYAEALQECFSSFYGSVGIPKIEPKSILDMLV